MGSHSSADDLMAGVESDAIRVKAAALAVQMHEWLTTDDAMTPLQTRCFDLQSPAAFSYHEPDSELVEWCRSARDILEAIGRG